MHSKMCIALSQVVPSYPYRDSSPPKQTTQTDGAAHRTKGMEVKVAITVTASESPTISEYATTSVNEAISVNEGEVERKSTKIGGSLNQAF